MKVAIIVGSIRKGRKSDKIALYLRQILDSMPDISCTYLDLATHKLPLLDNRWDKEETIDTNLESMSEVLQAADALLFISPEYHGSYTGVLKNAVDHYWQEFSQKVIGVVCTGSGKFGGINASNQLQQLILSLGAYPMPRKLLIPFIQRAFDEDLVPANEQLTQEIDTFIREFLWFGKAVASAKRVPVNNDHA